ncbi:M16 family metallopeptidase [Mucilaginibacter sp. FT3.2]|uniref:M16 family metallopeptidase n=1 Tax=Mucilaginibacter sp. FT3.2 TaxID=2723090 RepID=UPI0016201A00|nr:pitrilysin family protein [Mucilaginibacter sp. FT3.2]MBB6231442.1 putative Zn-dependent peptidase [Mucilaginibacter sp. FT3.2]
MKKILTTLFLACYGLSAVLAQTETTSFDVDGIKVIFKPTPKEIINVRMYYRGGVANYQANQAGIESFTLEATGECGTKKYNANIFRDRADKYGIDIGSEAEYDYGNIQMQCVTKYFNEGWDLFTEAVVNPVFDANEVELLRSKIVAKVRGDQSDPDKRVEQLVLQNAFEGTAYATDPNGTDEVLSKLTAADLKTYYTSVLNKNQMFIVVAGKITKAELVAKIHASFATLPSKPYTPATLHEPLWNDYKVVKEDRTLQTNYLNAIMNSPAFSSDDYVPYRVGISALGGSLFSELRTKLNLSYDPGTYSVMQQMPYGIMYVSTTDPKAAILAMNSQVKKVLGYGLSPEGLQRIKSSFITTNYIKQQSTASITGSLGIAEVLGGWQFAEDLPKLLEKVTVDQINQAMYKYIVGLRWSYLGDPAKATEAADAFKEVIRE